MRLRENDRNKDRRCFVCIFYLLMIHKYFFLYVNHFSCSSPFLFFVQMVGNSFDNLCENLGARVTELEARGAQPAADMPLGCRASSLRGRGEAVLVSKTCSWSQEDGQSWLVSGPLPRRRPCEAAQPEAGACRLLPASSDLALMDPVDLLPGASSRNVRW